MKAEQWKRVEELFAAAQQLPVDARGAFLLEACGDDHGLRGEVESLLSAAGSSEAMVDGSPFSSITERPALTPGSKLGNFQIVAPLGRGGMGEVYRARDLRLKREVAIKTLPPAWVSDRDRILRFEREARAVAALNHPNIVNLFDIGTETGILYTVSELVEGESLRVLPRKGPVPVRKLVDIAVQLADGLAAAHAAGITHRDLKPENVMLTREERVKILDFGLARRSEPVAEQATLTGDGTGPGMLMGTVSYMSPEQASGLPVGPQSDQFSFGLVLYELATARRAFHGKTALETLTAIVNDDPPPMEAKLPPPLAWSIERCLAKDPAKRYESTRDLYEDLRVLRDHLSEAYSGLAVEPGRAARKAGRLWKWIAIPACALALAELWQLLTRGGDGDLSRYRYRPVAMERGLEYGPQWSPDGKAVAYIRRADGKEQVFVRFLDSNVRTQIAAHSDFAAFTRWSSDSKRILFFAPLPDFTSARQTKALYSVPVFGAEPEQVIRMPDPSEIAAYWEELSPDNRTMAIFGFTKEGKSTVVLSSPLGSPYRQYEPAPFASKTIYNGCKLRFSPNGKRLLLVRTGDAGREEAWLLPYPPGSAAPHRVVTQFPAWRITNDFSWMPDNRHIALTVSMGGNAHAWIADTESDDAYQITGGVNSQGTLAVSPDGAKIIYAETENDWDVVTVSVKDGTFERVIATDLPETMPAWSSRTEELAYVTDRGGSAEIRMRSADGSDRPLVTQNDFPGNHTQFLMNPALSPDGSQLIFTRCGEEGATRTWIKSLTSGSPQRLNESADDTEYAGTWSPDGRRFAELLASGSSLSLALVKVGFREKPMVHAGVYDSPPDWSPDGEWLSFRDASGWNLISEDGQIVKRLKGVSTPYLTFSKDGKRLYGIRLADGKTTLFSFDPETLKSADIRELGNDLAPSSNYWPGVRLSLSPDGKGITYAISNAAKSDLWLLEGFRQPGLLARLGLRKLNWGMK
jgi:Tol biopolymer transport system component